MMILFSSSLVSARRVATIFLFLCSVVWAEDGNAAIDRPNIIFIFADDWGYGDLGIHGSTFCETPNLDRMAAEGIDFQNFTVNNPVCSPSRVAVLTGQFPARHSVHQHFHTVQHHVSAGMPDWLNAGAPMLPRMLQESGYVTGHYGKWHLSNDEIPDAPLPTAYGFDEFDGFDLPGEAPEIPTAETCASAVEFIKRHKVEPFFINLWLHETHTPHYPLEPYLERFKHLDEQERVYAAVVAEADAGVGLVLDTLKELGLDDKTLVIFSSDNGPENTGDESKKWVAKNFTGPGYGTYYSVGEKAELKGQKRSLYAGGVRVPFIVRWPGVVPEGKTDRDSVLTAVDLLPTLLELAGAELPGDYKPDGESMVAAFKGEGFMRTKPIFWEWRGANDDPDIWPHWGIRDGKWKLLRNDELGKMELYNIEADWAEATDVSGAHPEIVEQMRKQIDDWSETLPTAPPAHCFSRLRE